QTVFPGISRLEEQRKLCQLLYRITDRAFLLEQAAADTGVAVCFAQARIPLVGQPGSVGEQVEDGDGPPGVHQRARRRSLVLGIRRVQDLHVLELRDEVGDRLVQREAPLFVEHHDRNARDRLGHGADAKNAVGAHGLLRIFVGHAECLEVGDLAMTGDQAHAPCKTAVVNAPLNDTADTLQALGGQSNRFGSGEETGFVGRQQSQSRTLIDIRDRLRPYERGENEPEQKSRKTKRKLSHRASSSRREVGGLTRPRVDAVPAPIAGASIHKNPRFGQRGYRQGPWQGGVVRTSRRAGAKQTNTIPPPKYPVRSVRDTCGLLTAMSKWVGLVYGFIVQ